MRRLWREMWRLGRQDQTLSWFCFCCCDKTPDRSHVRENKFLSAHSSSNSPSPWWSHCGRGETAGHVHRQAWRENECTHTCAQLSPLTKFRISHRGNADTNTVLVSGKLGLPTSVSTFKIIPHSISTGQLDLDSPHRASPLSSF